MVMPLSGGTVSSNAGILTGSFEGQVPMRDFSHVRTAPSKHASRATSWESSTRHHLGKQVYHMEPDSASMTAWICHRAVLLNWNDNLLEVSRLYALMRKRTVPPHRTEPFIKVGAGRSDVLVIIPPLSQFILCFWSGFGSD
jgi:hypothetical protein